MGEMMVVDVDLREEDVLVEALKAMGLNPTIHAQGVKMDTYYSGRTKPTAHVVCAKGQKGLRYAGLGFERQANGGFKMHKDDSDRFNTNKLKQHYTEKKIEKIVRRTSRFSVKNRSVDKKGRITIRVKRNF